MNDNRFGVFLFRILRGPKITGLSSFGVENIQKKRAVPVPTKNKHFMSYSRANVLTVISISSNPFQNRPFSVFE